MSEPISITLRLGNRQYKLKVAPENEEHVRKSISNISHTINELKKAFTGRDEQDYMAMTLIDYITKQEGPPQTQSSNTDDPELLNRLKNISNLLDS